MSQLRTDNISPSVIGQERIDSVDAGKFYKNEGEINSGKPSEFGQTVDRLIKGNAQSEASPSADSKIKFSKHAIDRMLSRGIGVDQGLIDRLEKGLKMVEGKGGRDPIIITDQGTFVVNVPNKTVVTVLGKDGSQVFTNIDSAVFV